MAADMRLSAELASVPFEDLVKLKDKLGSKIYSETIFGTSAKRETSLPKRLNKNRPREVSSKLRVTSHIEVFPTKNNVKRDPRFDESSGLFDETVFRQTYGFLEKYNKNEKRVLKERLKDETDEEKCEEIKMLLTKMSDRERTVEIKKKRSEEKQVERTRIKQELKEGKSPFFLKKSEKKKLELAQKFKELKSSGKLEKYMQKKRKRTAQTDRKHLPFSK